MNATPTLSEAVGAELKGLLDLGFTDSQAKTIIVSAAITAANESKKIVPAKTPTPKLTALIDSDGDRWVPSDTAPDLWHCDTDTTIDQSRESVERIFGPVEEVYA